MGDIRFALRETEIGSYLFMSGLGECGPPNSRGRGIEAAVLSQALIGLSTHEVVSFAGEQRDPSTAMNILRPKQEESFHSSTGQQANPSVFRPPAESP